MMPAYEIRTMRGNGQYLIKCMAEGFRQCRKCDHMIKHDGKYCPVCGYQLRQRLHTMSFRETQAKVAEFLKNGMPTHKRTCSRCGGSKTRQKQGANGPMWMWLKDGKGGYICYGCYSRRRKQEGKA